MNENASKLSRRNFIKITGISGAVLAIGYYLPSILKETNILHTSTAEKLGVELNAWISIDTSGHVTIVSHRAEMGQGSFQSIPQIIAEELEVDFDKISIAFANGNPKKYGDQTTGGSSSIRDSYKKLLVLSATAREMLIEVAAKRWNVPKGECKAENGQVLHPSSDEKFHYGELVEEASKLTPPQKVELKKISDYKIIRQSIPRKDIPAKTTGETIFGLDKKVPEMLYAVIERNPRFIGKVKSFDKQETMKIPGIKQVFKIQVKVFNDLREGIVVVAESFWAAQQGRKVLKIDWDDSGFEHYNTAQLYSKFNNQFKRSPLISKTKGTFHSAFNSAAKKLSLRYETPYQSHSCMEPLNCLADVKKDSCEIWAPTQQPDLVQKAISETLGFALEKVTIHMTFLGGGFGRKAFNDFPLEAALISKEINAPVKLIWAREEDTSIGPFRPGMVYQCQAGLNPEGTLMAFQTIMAGQSIEHQNPGADKSKANHSTSEGFPHEYLDFIPHYTFGDVPVELPIPVMWWRSVYSSTNAFAYESFIDELAILSNQDPLAFRKRHLKKVRYQLLISKLEEVSNWNSRAKNDGYGVAVTECFKTIVGQVVKLSKTADDKITIEKVWAVIDCGWFVNPDIIRAQVEGSIVMALGAATMHQTIFEDGLAIHKNFNSYPLPRMKDIPEIEVHIMENQEEAGGVGEPALPTFAPALANAFFDLTGKRIRKLPFDLNENS